MFTKKNIITGVVLASLILAVVWFYQFGWQHAGFKMVTHPDLLLLQSVSEEADQIVIRGETALSIGSYAGSVLEYREGVLYVGVRFSLFGEDPTFEIKYPQSNGAVDRIVLRKNDLYRTIWIRAWEEATSQ